MSLCVRSRPHRAHRRGTLYSRRPPRFPVPGVTRAPRSRRPSRPPSSAPRAPPRRRPLARPRPQRLVPPTWPRHWAARRGRERRAPPIGCLCSPLCGSPNAGRPRAGLAARAKVRPPLAPRGRRVPPTGERPRGPSGGRWRRRPGSRDLRCSWAAGSSRRPRAPEVGAGREGRPAAERAGGRAALRPA